jgi:alpha-1,6-mannosyltransferase
MFYLGSGRLVGAWVWLGREVLAERSAGRTVLVCSATWLAPMLVSPPLFTPGQRSADLIGGIRRRFR